MGIVSRPQSAMDPRWLADRLVETVEEVARFVADIPLERRLLRPPAPGGFARLGDWSAHRHLFHLVHYDRYFALPALQSAVDGRLAATERQSEVGTYDERVSCEDLIGELQALRREQHNLLSRADGDALAKTVEPWGKSALWSVAKTVQHTAEHIHALASIALFWDRYAERLATTREHPYASAARLWLSELQECVRAVDYARARPLFADDVVSFGTHASVVKGRDVLERDQWQHVWPNIRDFTFRLDELNCIGDDRYLVAIVPWDSLGTAPDGTHFQRPGRATVALSQTDGRWIAVHSHFSLFPRP